MQKITFIFFIFFSLIKYSYAKDEYFLTLRNDKVNLRQGPSFDHPVKIFYKKKFLPVLVQDSSENFRKIKDHENNTGWIHVSQLSKKKAAITVDDQVIIFKNSIIFSKPLAVLEKGRLCLISKCDENFCKIKTGEYKGWVRKQSLWGKL